MAKKKVFSDNGAASPKFIGDRVLPHSEKAEIAVIAAITWKTESFEKVVHILKQEHFYSHTHQEIFKVVSDLYKGMNPIDKVTVVQKLFDLGKINYGNYVFDISNDFLHNDQFLLSHANIILNKYIRRQNVIFSQQNIEDSYNETEFDNSDLIQKLYDQTQELNVVELNSPEEINLSTKLLESTDIIKFKGLKFLSAGNISGIIAGPGAGKSNIMDAIVAKAFNKNCDGLGFEVNLFGDGIYHVDTERSHNDSYYGYLRICDRINVERNPDLILDGELKGYKMARYKEVAKISNRRNRLQRAIVSKKFKLFLVDGITDFMLNPMEPEESQEIVNWLGALASKYNVAILCTIHNNPKTNKRGEAPSGAPRGHIGSELFRKAEGMLFIGKDKDDPDIKLITTDFEFAKLRNDGGRVDQYFSWDREEKHMFVSRDDYKKSPENPKKMQEIKNSLDRALAGGAKLTRKELANKIREINGKSIPVLYNWITKGIENGWVNEDLTTGKINNGTDGDTPF